MRILLQIFGYVLRQQNVAGITAVHNPLCHVDPGTSYVCLSGHVVHTTQRIPEREQTQSAIAQRTRNFGHLAQLLQGKLFLARPGTDNREELNQIPAHKGIPCNRKQLERTAAFSQGVVLPTESCVNEAEDAERGGVLRLSANDLLLLNTRSGEGGMCCCRVALNASD